MPYAKIIAGTDGSATATTALKKAVLLAKANSARLLLVSAYERPPERAVSGWEVGPQWRSEVPASVSWQLSPSAIATEIVDKARTIADSLGADVEARSEEGHAGEVLLDLAESERIDLIVVGNVGMTGGKRFLLGSIPDRVSHHTPCDLLIVRTTDGTQTDNHIYRRILIGTDGSPTANKAVAKGYDLARVLGSWVLLLYVGNPADGEPVLEETIEKEGAGVPTEPRILQGDPADVICDIAEQEKVDLILLGNRGMQGPRRFLLGGVPNQVSHYAPTDVLIVKTV